MFTTLKNAWHIAELRKKICYTLLILILFRVGSAVPVPFLDSTALQAMVTGSGNLLGYIDILSGGAFSRATVFALSITPYITSSIVIQLLTVAIPALERLSKEGEDGRKKINKITRYVTVALALLQAFAYYTLLRNQSRAVLYRSGFAGIFSALVIIAAFTAGAMLVVYLGERIDENGVGNGISIILFAGILARVPNMISGMIDGVRTWSGVQAGSITLESLISGYESAGYSADLAKQQAEAVLGSAIAPWGIALLLVGVLALIVFIVFISDAERRIPVQYAKRQVGRKMYGGQSSTLPMKVNMSGVLPIIFAQSIATLPITIWSFIGVPDEGTVSRTIYDAIDTQSIIYMVVYFVMIIGFSYFYSSIQFNPVEIANNLKKQGGFIPGFRPGKPTVDFIKKVLGKITLFGAIYLGIVAICPLLVGKIISNTSVAIGGTSVIIVVGVALETVKALENQMLMRQYKGFLE